MGFSRKTNLLQFHDLLKFSPQLKIIIMLMVMIIEIMTGLHLMALMGKNLPVSFSSFLMLKDTLLHT